MYESSLSEKREEIAFLNREQKRIDNVVTSNNGNTNDEISKFFILQVVGTIQFLRKSKLESILLCI